MAAELGLELCLHHQPGQLLILGTTPLRSYVHFIMGLSKLHTHYYSPTLVLRVHHVQALGAEKEGTSPPHKELECACETSASFSFPLIFFKAATCSMQDLSSLPKDQTHVLCIRSMESSA